MARRRLEIEIAADTTKLNRGLAQANRSLAGFGRGVTGGKTGSVLDALGLSKGTVAFASAGIATAALTKGLGSVVRAAKDAQEAQAGLRQALAATGISWADNQKAIDKAIQSTSKIAGIDDEEVSRSFANLVRTTGSVTKATRDVALAANIARARHISLAAATKIVEKAEIGQFRGLKTIGIQLGKNVTATEAIDAAQKKFAGSAEAYGRTAAGAQDKLGVAFENLQERIGTKLLPVLTRLTLALVRFIDFSEKNWPKFSKAVADAYQKVRPLVESLKRTIQGIANTLAGTVKLIAGLAHGDWAKAWDGLKQVAVKGIGAIVLEMIKLPARLLAALGKEAFKGLEKIGGWIKDAIIAGMKDLGQALARVITAAVDKALEPVRKAISAANAVTGQVNRFSPLPDIPKIPNIGHLGQQTPKAASKVRIQGGFASLVTPSILAGGGGININTVNLNGVQNPQQFLSDLQRISRTSSAQSRGRTPGTSFFPGHA